MSEMKIGLVVTAEAEVIKADQTPQVDAPEDGEDS